MRYGRVQSCIWRWQRAWADDLRLVSCVRRAVRPHKLDHSNKLDPTMVTKHLTKAKFGMEMLKFCLCLSIPGVAVLIFRVLI